jgi:type II secretory pathway pseudopilin PulG
MRKLRGSETGETLVETLIALAILGITVTAVLGGLATIVSASSRHRDLSNATAAVRGLAEDLEQQARQAANWKCADHYALTLPAVYRPPTQQPAFNVNVTAQSWNGTSFVTCSPSQAVQKASLVVSNDRAKATLDVVLRKPCPTATPC